MFNFLVKRSPGMEFLKVFGEDVLKSFEYLDDCCLVSREAVIFYLVYDLYVISRDSNLLGA